MNIIKSLKGYQLMINAGTFVYFDVLEIEPTHVILMRGNEIASILHDEHATEFLKLYREIANKDVGPSGVAA